MYHITSLYNGQCIGQTNDPQEAARIAAVPLIGDYCNVIWENGRIVGDSVDGFTGPRSRWEGRDESAGSVLTGRELD